jgi:hypothetical protein
MARSATRPSVTIGSAPGAGHMVAVTVQVPARSASCFSSGPGTEESFGCGRHAS